MIDLGLLHAQAVADRRRPVVGALILDERGRVFVHRRGPDRAFLPNGWDLVGGHVEAGETLLAALHREVAEETGWSVVGTPSLAFVGDWRTDRADPSTCSSTRTDSRRPSPSTSASPDDMYRGPFEAGPGVP